MNLALMFIGAIACLAFLAFFLIIRQKDTDFDLRSAASFVLVACLIPPLVYTFVEFDHLISIVFLSIAFGGALCFLFFTTRTSSDLWALTLGVQGFWVLISILLVSIACCLLLKYPVIYWYCWLAALFGTLVGAAEIFSRYPDEPLDALLSSPGLLYQGINGAIAAAAYGLLREYQTSFIPTLKDDLLLTSIVAGFGAMAVMRSKFFSYKSASGDEFAFGPDVVITIFLRSVDRAIDRARSFKREQIVFETTKDIAYSNRVPKYFKGSLPSFQNLSNQEKATLVALIDSIASDPGLDPHLKLMAMAFGFLNISGEKNYYQLIANLKEYLKLPETTTALAPTVSVANNAAAVVHVNLSATVSTPSGAVNEGSVTFRVTDAKGNLVGTPKTSTTVAAGAATVVYDLPAGTPAGTYTVEAEFERTPYLGSTDTKKLTVT